MSALRTEKSDGVIVITLDLPGEPVNKITRGLREEFDDLLPRVEADSDVMAAVLISGKPGSFIAGADIDEFVKLESREQAEQLVRAGQGLINRFEESTKPFVAAIDGACLGGGLETALACTYRIAASSPSTRLGLPEVQLGILPAAGGCQRLPRLIGARAALDMILAGKTVPAKRALRLGIVDELVHPAILRYVALHAARRLAEGWRPKRKRGGLAGLLLDGNRLGRSIVFRAARRQVGKKTGGNYPAPLAAIDAIRVGLNRGRKRGLEREAQHFGQLAVSEVSRNLVKIFFATTALKKDLGTDDEGVEPNEVRNVGVVGAGFMGAAIGGVAALRSSVDVRFREADWDRLSRGLGFAKGILKSRLERRRLTKYEYRNLVPLISGTTDWSGFGRTDLVIEAVFEDLGAKHEVFRQLEEVVGDRCVLASNTSTIPIAQIASATEHPERVIGMHFFSPVEKMPLLEIIVADETAPWATATAVNFGRQMGKTVIAVRDRPGFWVNRILGPYMNEAGRLLEEGVPIETIDRLMTEFGFPVGPITLLDEIGLDVAAKASRVMSEAFSDRITTLTGLQKMVDLGRLGRKSGRGFYSYEKGKKKGVDQSVYEVLGVSPSARTSQGEVRDRLVYSMLNEAARAYEEGVVRSARDGDLGAIFGIGYPPFRGGPLTYIDSVGAAQAVAALKRLAVSFGERLAPAPLLERMAETGGRFYPDN